jgi:hypothetical protein
LHKNRSLFNKWIFIDNYEETLEKEDENISKVINIKDCFNVLEYKTNKVFITLEATCKFNLDFKFQNVQIRIKDIEIFDELNGKNLNFFAMKSAFISLYYNFKSFMEVRITII